MTQLLLSDRIKGAIWGFIIGDAFGLPIKNQPREHRKIYPIDMMTGWGTYNLPPGHWSDESSLMLAAVDAEISYQLNRETLMDALKEWYYDGNWSSDTKVIEVSEAMRISLENYVSNWNFSKEIINDEFENGSDLLGIVLPVLFSNLRSKSLSNPAPIYAGLIKDLYETPKAVMGLTLFHLILLFILQGKKREEIPSTIAPAFKSLFSKKPFKNHLKEFQFLTENPASTSEQELISDTSVEHVIHCALWAYLNSSDFVGSLKNAANLGGYTDGISACTGALAGATYGIQQIPSDWFNYIVDHPSIDLLIRKFIQHAMQPAKQD